MAELILFWGEKDEPAFSWRLSSNQEGDSKQTSNHHLELYQLESHEILKADLACIAEMAESNKVTVVVSCIDVSAAQVEVPNKAQRLLRKAVPYILEEEIASSVDDLFFALGDKNRNGLLSVRAIDRNYLESIIEAFASAEIRLFDILVDIDLFSLPEEGSKLLVNDSVCLSVDADDKRWHCHPDDYSWLIQKQLSHEETDDDLPNAIPLDIYSEQPTDEFERQLPVGRFAIQQHQINDNQAFLLQQDGSGINLLQAEYETKKENSQITQFLTKAASVIGFVLFTFLIFQGVNIYTLSEKKAQLEQQKFTLYKQAFPSVKKIRNPEKSMKVYVGSLGSASEDAGFLSLLNSSTEQLTDLQKIYPTNISYDRTRNELRLDVIASDLIVLDQYAEALKSSGHQVEKSSETQRGDGYSSRITIRK